MNRFPRAILLLLTSLVALGLFVGCAQAPTHSYVVDYQVVGDKTVKYVYVPGERSDAGNMFFNQSVALEICSMDEAAEEDGVEYDCRLSRVLRTQEYK